MDLLIKLIGWAAEQTAEVFFSKGLEEGQKNFRIAKLKMKCRALKLEDDFAAIYLHALKGYKKSKPHKGWVKLFELPEVYELYQEAYHNKKEMDEVMDEAFVKNIEQIIRQKASEDIDRTDLYYKMEQGIEKPLLELEQLTRLFKKQYQKALPPSSKETQDKIAELEAKLVKQENELRKKSFPYQAEQYLHRFIKRFETQYLSQKEVPKYIPVHGETRMYKETARGAHFKKNSSATSDQTFDIDLQADEKEQYKATPFKPINNFLNNWLQDDSQNLLILVGEYGTGKTTLMRYLTYHLGRQYLHGQADDAPLRDAQGRLPLFMPLNKFEQQLSSFVEVVCKDEGISDIDFSRFKGKASKGELLIILDGFDEMTQYINSAAQLKNFGQIQRQLLDSLSNSKVILTTRIEYFKSLEAREYIFQTARQPNFGYVYVQPFENEQVRLYLQAHGYGDEYWEQVKEVLGSDNDVMSRPVLLEIMVKHLKTLLERCKMLDRPLQATDLYQLFINEELRRKELDLIKRNWLIQGKDRLPILEAVALWMYREDVLHFDVNEIGEALDFEQYFNARTKAEYENFLHEFLTFTFLKPQDVALGTFRISHKSFMEYLVAQAMVNALHTPHAAEVWGKGKNPLSDEIIKLIRELKPNQAALLQLILEAKDLPDDQLWQGTNAAKVLLELNGDALVGQDLTDCQLSGVNFRSVNLKGILFKNANLSNCQFHENLLEADRVEDCDFKNSILTVYEKQIKIGSDVIGGTLSTKIKGFANLHSIKLDFVKVITTDELLEIINTVMR